MIEGTGLSFSYGRGPAVDGIDVVSVPERLMGLIGPNGSGKSTLLRLLHGRLRPASGRVMVDGRDLAGMSARDIARSIAVVVQEHEPVVELSAAEMVMLGRLPRGGLGGPAAADHAAAESALEQVGLLAQAERPLSAMSGGEQQRVMIARAMAQETEHLLLDEPTNHLDIRYQHEVLSTVRQLRRTSIVVLHDLNLAAQYCDELVLLDHGRIDARGTPDEVLRAEVLEPVYRIGVRRWDDDGIHLSFGLRD